MTILMVLVLTLFFIPNHADAITLHVGPGQTYSTIQSALNAASDNDTIEIHRKTGGYKLYDGGNGGETSNLSTSRNGLTIRGKAGEVVIINGNKPAATANFGLRILAGSQNITIENLRFTNCRRGAIHFLGTGHTITNVRFRSNWRSGVLCQASNVTFTNFAFLKERSTSNPKGMELWCIRQSTANSTVARFT